MSHISSQIFFIELHPCVANQVSFRCIGPQVSTEVALLPDKRVVACAAPTGVDVADSSSVANDEHRVDGVVPEKGWRDDHLNIFFKSKAHTLRD